MFIIFLNILITLLYVVNFDLPYLEYDSHFSKIGNQIFSKNIIKIIND